MPRPQHQPGRPAQARAKTRTRLSLLLSLLALPACQQLPPSQDLLDAEHEVCRFGGEGEVLRVAAGIELDQGAPLTGLRWPRFDPGPAFEILARFRKLEGDDFPLALTFPLGDSHCSLVLGGWGGTVCGLSNLDGADADHNPTRFLHEFRPGVPYRLRLQVEPGQVRAWLDGALVLRQPRPGHRFSLRPEVELCRPLGLACYNTWSRIEQLSWRRL